MVEKVVIAIISLALVLSMTSSVFADTKLTPIDSTKGIEKTITSFTVTKNNKLPWGFVEGKVTKDRKSTRLNSSHSQQSRMPSSA